MILLKILFLEGGTKYLSGMIHLINSLDTTFQNEVLEKVIIYCWLLQSKVIQVIWQILFLASFYFWLRLLIQGFSCFMWWWSHEFQVNPVKSSKTYKILQITLEILPKTYRHNYLKLTIYLNLPWFLGLFTNHKIANWS